MKSSSLKSKLHFKQFFNSIRNHKSLKTCTIDLLFSINPRTILKLIQKKIQEIHYLTSFSLSVSAINEKDKKIFESFFHSYEFQCSPVNSYFILKFNFTDDKDHSSKGNKYFCYFLTFINKNEEKFKMKH